MIRLEQDDLEALLRDADLSKPLSMMYKTLLPSIQVGLDGLHEVWHVVEEEELDIDDWEDMWDFPNR